jgi:hypothetical protein
MRALLRLHATAARVDPQRDSLREGLEAVRMTVALGQFKEFLNLGAAMGTFRRYASVLPDLPRRLDEVLTTGAEGSLPVQWRGREAGTGANRRGGGSAAALLTLAALTLAVQQLVHAGVIGGWALRGCGMLALVTGGIVVGRLWAWR